MRAHYAQFNHPVVASAYGFTAVLKWVFWDAWVGMYKIVKYLAVATWWILVQLYKGTAWLAVASWTGLVWLGKRTWPGLVWTYYLAVAGLNLINHERKNRP